MLRNLLRFTNISALNRRDVSQSCKLPQKSTADVKTFKEITPKASGIDKISIIGSGQLGSTIAALLLDKRMTNHIVMVDKCKELVEAEALDIQHASSLIGSPMIETCTDASCTRDSKYVVITVGSRPSDTDRFKAANRTIDRISDILPALGKASPNGIFIVCSSPVDAMTWAVQKLCGLPKSRCISAGCHLDTLRFRHLVAQRLGCHASSVHGYVIGEHGDSLVPVWSSLSVGGISFLRIMPDIGTKTDKEQWQEIHDTIVNVGCGILKSKIYSNMTIALAVVDIIEAMQENSGRILSVGTDVAGLMNIEDNIVMSLPCVLGTDGIKQVIELPLTSYEMELFEKSANMVLEAQTALKI